jgi:O-antigen/teichoic acid export membrane protein
MLLILVLIYSNSAHMKGQWSDFKKDAVSNILGTILAQSIPILIQPVLRRLFSPEEFGVAAVYFSIVTVLCVAVGLNYHSAVVLPKSEKDAKGLLLGSTLIAFFISCILWMVIFFCGEKIVFFFGLSDQLIPWLYLIPISAFLNSIHLSFGNWLTRLKAYQSLAINKVSRRFFEGGFQWGLGSFSLHGGLLIGTLLGDFFNALTYWLQFKKLSGHFKGIGLADIKVALVRYSDFFKISLITNLMSKVSYIIPVLVTERLYSTAITGQLDLGRQILALPLSLITVGIAQVMLQQLSVKVNDRQTILPLIQQVFTFLVLMSIMICLVMFFWGEDLFAVIFGEEWRLGGVLASWLVWSYAFRFIIVPLSNVLIVLEKLKWNSLWQGAYFIMMLLMFLIREIEIQRWIQLIVLVDIIAYSIYGWVIWKATKVYETNITA